MVKKFLKKQSKRMPAKKRYKIEKKVKDHNRKIKKMCKNQKTKGKKNKLIIVPGDCPFKKTILEEAISMKQTLQKEKLARREEIKAKRKAKKDNILMEKRGITPPGAASKPATTLEELMKKAEDRGYVFEKVQQQKNQRDPSLKAFYREFQQVISDSDVIIQVLDSRDPLGTRSSEAEEAVRSHSDKKLLFVLNKCDLVPVENLQNWITYLRQTESCVVLPFKANTQKQKDRLGSVASMDAAKGSSINTKKSVGVSDLMGLLGTWARGSAGGLTIGVVGMPNVGKSSLINSLKRSRACNVGAKPGVTRSCQIVSLDKNLKLIDSPGVCFSKEKGSEAMTVETILTRVPHSVLMAQYGISDFKDIEEFLAKIALKLGQIKKGGVPNQSAAEQKIIHDWHTGSIRFYTEPPELSSTTTSSAIVSDMGAPFSLDNFLASANDDDDDEDDMDFSHLTPWGYLLLSDEEKELDDDDVEMDDGNDDDVRPGSSRNAGQKKVTFAVQPEPVGRNKRQKDAMHKEERSTDVKKKIACIATKKTFLKKIRKAKKKSAKHASKLSDIIENFSLDM